MRLNIVNPLEKGLKSTIKHIPLEFKWLVYAGLWDGIKIPLPRLMQNRKAFQYYKAFSKQFPASINEKFEKILQTNCTQKDLDALKNVVSKRDAVFYQNTLKQADQISIEEKKMRINAWRETTRQVILEELQITEPITEQEMKDIIEGKKDKKIAEGLTNAK